MARTRLTRTESRNETRRMLREAAIREFALNGYAGVSAEGIAESAGFSGGAFYSNYRGKQEILVEIMRESRAKESLEWQHVISKGTTVDAIIDKLARRSEKFAREQNWPLMEVELELRAVRDKDFQKEYALYRTERRNQVRIGLEALFAKSGKKTPESIETLVDALLAFFLGLGLYFMSEKSPARRKAMMAIAYKPYFYNLLAKAEPLATE